MRWKCGVLSAMVVFPFLFIGATAGVAVEMSGRALFEKKCGACHSIDRPKSQGKTRAEWQATVLRMKGHGAALTDADIRAVVDHLAGTYPKK
jgi:cytochrome c5